VSREVYYICVSGAMLLISLLGVCIGYRLYRANNEAGTPILVFSGALVFLATMFLFFGCSEFGYTLHSDKIEVRSEVSK
jgi:putative exporter of polyketide antibiotics